ncbi:MAG: flavodoxin domain-containing protein [Chloroflexi bacterium]|nr:flavodoxin domain-containing protein [Chloroflexota bacterium]
MNDKILITYASRSGSTAEIAEAIGKTIAQNGAQVDVLPMREVTDLTLYRAVVAGSAIRKSKWLPEAMQFVQTLRSELRQKPFATFTVSITLAMSNTDQYRQAVSEWIQPVRLQVRPLSEGLFAGMLDFHKLPLTFDSLLLGGVVALGIFPKGDRRDWNAIRSWAEGIRPLL